MSAANEPAAQPAQQALETETVIDTYSVVAEWIRFADTKAGVTLTINGVLIGMLIPTLKTYLAEDAAGHPTSWWTQMVVTLFMLWLVTLVVSAINSFLCILPFRGTGRQMALSQATHFHPAAIAQKYPLPEMDRFVDECQRMEMPGLKREVLAALLIDAHLSNSKYRYVTRSIQWLAISVIFGFLYVLAIQF